MKIAIYKDNLSTGRGADRAVRNFAASLAARGHDIALLERADFLARVIDGPARAFDVIVATGSNEIVDLDAAGYFDRPERARVVLQLHLAPRGFFKWRHPLRNRRIRKAFGKADAVQVLCGSYVDEFRRLAPRPPVTVIGNYTEMSPAPDFRRVPQPVILYPAAALNRVKNQRLLIEAFATLAAAFPEWRVRLLGKTSTAYAGTCRRLIRRLGLDGRISLVGFTDGLAAEYSRAAFVAFPSTLEGFPLAILEAARFGLPAVAQRDLPGVEDIVTEETGIVTAPTVTAYAEGLRRLMADASLRERLGAAARTRSERDYARDKILGAWESFLESVVK